MYCCVGDKEVTPAGEDKRDDGECRTHWKRGISLKINRKQLHFKVGPLRDTVQSSPFCSLGKKFSFFGENESRFSCDFFFLWDSPTPR